MSRPKPNILLQKLEKNYDSLQLIDVTGIFCVLYKNEPFAIRSLNVLLDKPIIKYNRTSFPNVGFAVALAKKLNKLFNCTDFTVATCSIGEIVPLPKDRVKKKKDNK